MVEIPNVQLGSALGVLHALPPAGVRGVAGVTKAPQKSNNLNAARKAALKGSFKAALTQAASTPLWPEPTATTTTAAIPNKRPNPDRR